MLETPDNRALYSVLGRLLLIGVVISMILMLVAAAAGALGGTGLPQEAPAFDLALASLVQLKPEGLLGLGLLVLFATPIASVGLALVAFVRQRDWFYAMVSILVLGILALSVAMAHR